MATEHVKCLIIGSGPAGYTAAIYTGRANLNPVVYEGLQPGGQLTITTEVENFPGYPEGVTGPVLMDDLRKQALRFGADIRSGIITKADLSEAPYKFTTDGGHEITADAVIISTGATAKYLGLEDEKKYAGMGVSAVLLATVSSTEEKSGSCRRRRYCMRRGSLSCKSCKRGLSCSEKTIPESFADYAGTCAQSS